MRLNLNGSITVTLAVSLALAAPAAARAQAVAGPAPRATDLAGAGAAPQQRPLSLRADYGGTEPGTSRQAFEGVVAYRGEAPYEVQAGYSYGDQVFYSSSRGFLTGYRYFNDGLSYVKADGSLRRYTYPADQTGRPNPDSNAYDWVWRGELEASHPFTDWLRGTVQYQLFPASFYHDGSSWTWNQKLSGEVELRLLPQLRVAARAAALRDPNPDTTLIRGRPIPGTATPAAQTHVVYRTTSLVGGWSALDLRWVALKLEYLPNRDLDNSYAWSLLTTVDVRPLRWLDVRLQQVHDRYASVSNFPGRTGEIWMGTAGVLVARDLRLRAGYRHVDVPTRAGGTVIAGVEWRTPLP
jgi:hypothetical protein